MIQNCLAKFMSCSEEPLNTSNPWGQISQASFPLLGLAPGLVSMATQDASTSSLAPLPALPLGKRSSWQLPGQKPLVYSVHVGVHRALVGSLKPTSAVITGFFETSLSLGVQIWESKHQFGGVSCLAGVSGKALRVSITVSLLRVSPILQLPTPKR